jgi:hypothetical protein
VRQEVGVSRGLESFTEEIPQMAEADKDHVADVGRQQDVIRRVLFFMVGNELARGVLRGEAVLLVRAMAKFRMDGTEDLFGSRGSVWVGKSVIVVVHLGPALAQNAVL